MPEHKSPEKEILRFLCGKCCCALPETNRLLKLAISHLKMGKTPWKRRWTELWISQFLGDFSDCFARWALGRSSPAHCCSNASANGLKRGPGFSSYQFEVPDVAVLGGFIFTWMEKRICATMVAVSGMNFTGLQDFHEEVVPHRAVIIQKEVAFVGHCGPWQFSGDGHLTSHPPRLSASVGIGFAWTDVLQRHEVFESLGV